MTHCSARHNAIASRDVSSAARRDAGVPFVGYGLLKQLAIAH